MLFRSIKTLINSVIIIILTYGCGFSIVKKTDLQDVYIYKIDASGDKRVNFDLKNKLSLKSKNTDKKKISLNIETNKNKTVKEKNSRNEITKYLLSINLTIKIEDENKILKKINLKEEIDYNVGSQYSQTINNEKEAVKTLTNSLVERIIREISLININDL